MASRKDAIVAASAKFPKAVVKPMQYGTAGFRDKAEILDSVVFRVGLLAALRSKKLNGQIVGVMITASHNPPIDNGVKLVDPMGEMLESSWESHATNLANAPSDEAVYEVYHKIISDLSFNADNKSRVVLARDTRPSGARLVKALTSALEATGTEYTDYGLLTTPQLHYVTRCLNTQGTEYDYGEPTAEGYYKKLAAAFKTCLNGRKPVGPVSVDCANGVGGPKLREFLKHCQSAADGGIDIKVVNDNVTDPEVLNLQCGADYVKTQQRAPPSNKRGAVRCCSFDGDADRLIYYYIDDADMFHMLDGDRIATLAALFIGDLVRGLDMEEKLKIGVVQTAYANGASTRYIEKTLHLPIACTNTGVKYLHHAAQKFDIGVYFEANGHGTVLFSDTAQRRLKRYETDARKNPTPAKMEIWNVLQSLTSLINQTVGDALSDMLLVEVILAHKGWGLMEWFRTYDDLPNKIGVVRVQDRTMFKTTDAERQLTHPPRLQEEITAIYRKYQGGRAFARPSGTEDVIRVYAEADQRENLEQLYNGVAHLIAEAGNST